MEVEEMPTPGCKFPRIRNGNGRADSSSSAKVGKKRDEHEFPEEEEADGDKAKRTNAGGAGGGVGGGFDITAPGGLGRLCGWPSSRIVRVSRASGGKDRHSKVLTSKGLRDRRVRLSVNTAIQFYDLQDRLGYDQPSKAVEWLLKAAATSIAELPSINTSFPDTPQQQLSDEKRSSTVGTEHGFDSAEVEMEGDELYEQHPPPQQQQQQHGGNNNFSKSACSSTSETSKGSGLSLTRSENRIKARERARGRAAEKEKEKEQQNNVNPISQSSFTELLTGGMNNSSNNNNNSSSPNRGNNGAPNESNFFQKSPRQWPSSTPMAMDYFATGFVGLSPSTRAPNPSSAGFLGQIHLGNHLHPSLTAAVSSPLYSVPGEHHSELQQFSFIPDHLVTAAAAGNGHTNSTSNGNGVSDYNLNFTISPSSTTSGFAGFNRGTLQSNSSPPSLLPHQVQRFSTIDRSPSAFFATTAPPNAAVAPVEDDHHQHHQHHHHHQQQHLFHPAGFDARLQLCYGDGGRHCDQKGKVKN